MYSPNNTGHHRNSGPSTTSTLRRQRQRSALNFQQRLLIRYYRTANVESRIVGSQPFKQFCDDVEWKSRPGNLVFPSGKLREDARQELK